MERSMRISLLAWCLMLGIAAAETAPARSLPPAVADAMLAQNRPPTLTKAQRERRLAEWRAARDCAIFHYNRFERLERAGDKARAEDAELDWSDWDDVALDIETELEMVASETLAIEAKMEAAHKAQIARTGWAGYEKAWQGKCAEVPD